MRFLHHRRQSGRSFSVILSSTVALLVLCIVVGIFAVLFPDASRLGTLFNNIFFPILLGFLAFAISQVPRHMETSVFLLLHDTNPKTERWHWVSSQPAQTPPQGTAFLEIQNNGHSFLEEFLVEVTCTDQSRLCYRIPVGLAAEKSLFLQVDRPPDQIAEVRVICFLSPDTELFSFGGPLHKKDTTAVFSTFSHDAKPHLSDTPEQLCRPELDQ